MQNKDFEEKNDQVYLNFALIAFGPLGEIKELQKLINDQCKKVRVIYQTVSAKRLKVTKWNI